MGVTRAVTPILPKLPEQKRNTPFFHRRVTPEIFEPENVKKMCPKNFYAPKKAGNNPNITNQSGAYAALQFDIPVYKENGAGGYIEFRAYDPERGKMRRKTIKINRV